MDHDRIRHGKVERAEFIITHKVRDFELARWPFSIQV